MSKIVLGRRGFDASSENVSAQESGVSDDEIVALGNQMGKGYFHTLKTLNLASFAFYPHYFSVRVGVLLDVSLLHAVFLLAGHCESDDSRVGRQRVGRCGRQRAATGGIVL